MAQQLPGLATKFDNLIQFQLPIQQKGRKDICRLSFEFHRCLMELKTSPLRQASVIFKKYSVIEVTVWEGIGPAG